MSERWFAIVATIIGILFIAITPPFQVSDEWSHYVRAEAIAQGHVTPDMTWQGDCDSFPAGIDHFVRALYRGTDSKFTLDELRQAMTIRRDTAGRVTLCFSSWYTPVPYLPQLVVTAASRFANVRPLITFYAGRLANLAFSILLIVAAMRIAVGHRNVIAAVALVPMAMSQLSSWSADAPTLAIAILLTAVLLRAAGRKDSIRSLEVMRIAALSLALALCKPVYFLITLLAVAIPRRRFRSGSHRVAALSAILAALVIGVAIASSVASHAAYNARFELHVNAGEQVRCITSDPARFVRVAAKNVHDLGLIYVEELIGRLGMTDVKLPLPVIWIEVVLLVLIALCAERIPASARFLSIAIVAATFAGILLSQYLIWTVVCAPSIDGVQGRYFLPIAVMGAAAFAAGLRVTERAQALAITVVAAIANVTALIVLLQRYWLF